MNEHAERTTLAVQPYTLRTCITSLNSGPESFICFTHHWLHIYLHTELGSSSPMKTTADRFETNGHPAEAPGATAGLVLSNLNASHDQLLV